VFDCVNTNKRNYICNSDVDQECVTNMEESAYIDDKFQYGFRY